MSLDSLVLLLEGASLRAEGGVVMRDESGLAQKLAIGRRIPV